ncbi:MAG TPA: hypothetical protein VGA97_09055 [Acidimicrobiia bacterium]
MTGDPGGLHPGVPRLWILPGGVAAGVGAAVAAGVVSRSLILDLIAWWPVWLALFGLIWLGRGRRLGPIKVSGLVPLAALGVVVSFLVGHLEGWPLMPSATGGLIGPVATDYEQATLSVDIEGMVGLDGADSTYLYQAVPVRWGGEVGLPEGFEVASESSVFIDLRPAGDPGLQVFAGWSIRLASHPSWDLTLSGSVTADLTDLVVTALDLSGSGVVGLGPVTRATEAVVAGEFEISSLGDTPIRVVGTATVPDDWEATDGGWRSPVPGEGWVLTVAPGSRVSIEGP